MPLYQTEGVVLHKAPAGEYDKTIVLFTEKEGIVRALVKGALRPGSKLGPLTEPLSWGLYELFRGRTQDRVTGCELRSSFPGILRDYTRLVYALYLCELEMLFSVDRNPDPVGFRFFVSVLRALDTAEDCWSAVRKGEMGILASAGFSPSLEKCVSCSGDAAEGAAFVPSLGGIVCERCLASVRDTGAEACPVSPGSRKTLLWLGVCPPEDVHRVSAQGSVRDEVGKLLKKYIEYLLGSRPKSFALVEKLEAKPPQRSRR